MANLLADLVSGKKKDCICLEVNPPKGVDVESAIKKLEGKIDAVDFLNVTDSALARMRCSGFAFASIAKSVTGKEPLVNLSCRDRNVIALQSDLLGAWTLGIRSVVALTGDAVSLGDHPDAKGVFEVNSVGLLNIINQINEGLTLGGGKLRGVPEFCSGVVVNPNAKNPNVEIRRLKKKYNAGAKYALSQPVFDIEKAEEFFKSAAEVGIPILVGLLPIKTKKSARNLNSIPGITIPDNLLAAIEAEADDERIPEITIDHCIKIANKVKSFVSGFHVVAGVTPRLAVKFAGRLRTAIYS